MCCSDESSMGNLLLTTRARNYQRRRKKLTNTEKLLTNVTPRLHDCSDGTSQAVLCSAGGLVFVDTDPVREMLSLCYSTVYTLVGRSF